MKNISLDIGTKTLKIVIGNKTEIEDCIVREHFSDPLRILHELENSHQIAEKSRSKGVLTGCYKHILAGKENYTMMDWTIPVIEYCREQYPDLQFIIDIGAASLSLVEIKDGKFHRFQTNSLCASGTGSFLDQQMLRMDLSYKDIETIQPTLRIPTIASRCAVFAKSDLIHRQQEGYTREQLWNGLVKGMAESCFTTLLRGTGISGKILLIGGLVRNRLFYHYFTTLFNDEEVIVPEAPEAFIARSGVYYLQSTDTIPSNINNISNRKDVSLEKRLSFISALKCRDDTMSYYDIYSNEINIDRLARNQKLKVFFGVDIGSTSTKGVLRDAESGELLFNIYRKTAGNPILAYQKLLKGIREYKKKYSLELSVQGMGTTGSGRKIVAAFAGADLVINEITAHLKGAVREYPEVRTIFEIGGQDSKYIQVNKGWMQDANMNYVCAAGTGSFLEEQAQVLNIGLDDFEKLSSGIAAPKMNDRCTVFMELDARKLIVDGFSRPEVVTSLLHAVCRNYLHRVVQNRPVEEPILFLGATARNRGLVESFQNILGKKIHTSRYSHIMGAIGITELLQNRQTEVTTSFKGWDIDNQSINIRERYCDKCHNRCRLVYLESGSSTVSWGHMCGKESGEEGSDEVYRKYFMPDIDNFIPEKSSLHPKIASKKHDNPFVYLPRALFYHSHGIIWELFFSELGFRVETSPESDRMIAELGMQYSPHELCNPMKLAIGHAIYLIQNGKSPIFLPYMIMDTENPKTINSYFCVITQSAPAILENILHYNHFPVPALLTPVINLSESADYNVDHLKKCLSVYHFSRKEIKRAFQKGVAAYETQLKNQLQLSRELSARYEYSNKPVLVFMGRAYNLYDEVLNLNLIRDTTRYGYTILPSDLLPATREDISCEENNMYWSYGQKFLAAAKKLKDYSNFFPIFLTNFNCGPDSFLLSLLEEIWSDRPYLILELDEHSGNAGYLTRIEAFLDRLKEYQPRKKSQEVHEKITKYSLKDKRLLFPPMHPMGSRLLAAAFRGHDFDAVAIEEENQETFQIGRSCLRGSECLPAVSTFGAYLKYHKINRENQEKPWALFMPCASGPCRFGQYRTLQRMTLKRLGIDTDIFSVNSENNYNEITGSLRLLIMKSIIITDVMIKLSCRIRPYLSNPDRINYLIEDNVEKIIENLESRENPVRYLKEIADGLNVSEIDLGQRKPLVGIVGEIYVRSSPFSNDYLIEKIERHGAEAWVAPFMEWFHYTNWLKKEKTIPLSNRITETLTEKLVSYYERKYYSVFGNFLSDRWEPDIEELIEQARPYIADSIRGEAILTIGRAVKFIEEGAKLIINVAPFSCMPGTIGSIVLKRIAQDYSVPIVSLYYDGFTSFEKELEHYLNNICL